MHPAWEMTRYEIAACPVCQRQDVRTLADSEQIKQQLERLWEFHVRRLRSGAPIQQLFDRAIFSQKPPLNVVQCNRCETVFRSPREKEEDVLETYQDEAPSRQSLDSLFGAQYKFFQPRVARLQQMAGRMGSVLEVGSYVGGFLRAATDAGWDAHGIDVNRHANQYARSNGCTVTECAIEDYHPRRKFDVVALWNCFDQLANPTAALTAVRALLDEGGHIAIRVPNGAFFARMLKHPHLFAERMLSWNNMATFPYRHGFTPASLRSLLENNGYRVVATAPDTLVNISSSWTRPWARWEERLVKAAMNVVRKDERLPWFEIYAQRTANE